MNPWSGAEPASEAAERELFARRARALEPAEIPSLESVLRAAAVGASDPEAQESRNREKRAARGAQSRAFAALALAAACLAAVTRLPSLPSPTTHASIAAEYDAAAPSAAIAPSMASAPTCELDDEVLMSQERACFPPTPPFTAAPKPALISVAPVTPVTPVAPFLASVPTESCAMSHLP